MVKGLYGLLFCCFTLCGFTQVETGLVSGIVTDGKTGEPIPFANIILKMGEEAILGTMSDFDGEFTLKPIPIDSYTIVCSYLGYFDFKDSISICVDNKVKRLSFELQINPSDEAKIIPNCNISTPYRFNTTIETTYTREDIQNSALRW